MSGITRVQSTKASLVSRAHALASSGLFATNKALKQQLKIEGYSLSEIAGHFQGRGFRQEIKSLIKRARDDGGEPCHVLIVEDDFIFATDLQAKIEETGAVAIGPAGSVDQALALISKSERISGAVLDIKLGVQTCFPVADALEARNIPYVFVTGYDKSILPGRFERMALFEKPLQATTLANVVQGFCS